jgi:hypothetical protein
MNDNFLKDIYQTIKHINALRCFSGLPNDFWPEYLTHMVYLSGAKGGIIVRRVHENEHWQCVLSWPKEFYKNQKSAALNHRFQHIATTSTQNGFSYENVSMAKSNIFLIAVKLQIGDDPSDAVAIFFLDHQMKAYIHDVIIRLQLVTDIPAMFQERRHTSPVHSSNNVKLIDILDLIILINKETKYIAAVITLCNEISNRFSCYRVSLGWLESSYIRIQAISHMEEFEKKMDAVQDLEAAMEEALDQDEEIIFPLPVDNTAVINAHEVFARKYGSEYMTSIPIRLNNDIIGTLCCERSTHPFEETDVQKLRAICDLVTRRLDDLKQNDRWIGSKIGLSLRQSLAKFLGLEHTFAKFMGILFMIILGIIIFGRWPYRVEGPCILKTDEVAYVPAPFDGFIYHVNVKVGDYVNKGDTLLGLDTRDLLLQESSAIYDIERHTSEIEKTRAQRNLAEMKIASARLNQSRANYERIRYYVEHATIKAPFKGIIVEGEKNELLGAPVHKGDILFKIACLDHLYVELNIDERDIHEIAIDATGKIALLSRPDLKYPIEVTQIHPMSEPHAGKNVFVVRAKLVNNEISWWRPGMSGIGKINAGDRNMLWIMTHRTVDFFQMAMW